MSSNAPQPPNPPATAGSTVSIAALVARHHVELYGYAFGLTGDRIDAEDLVQQVFLVAHARLHQLQQPAAARGWLYTILRNTYLKDRRRQSNRPGVDPEVDLDTLPDDRIEDNEDNLEIEGIDREQLQAALNALPDEFRVVVLMFYFEDSSYRQIAEQLGIPSGTVMSRLSRAKQFLRQRLREAQLRNEAAVTSKAQAPSNAPLPSEIQSPRSGGSRAPARHQPRDH